MVTLDEAIKTANNAVLMSVTAVSVLKSVSLLLTMFMSSQVQDPLLTLIIIDKFQDLNRKLTGASYNDVKEIEISEVFRVSRHDHLFFTQLTTCSYQ